MDDFLDAPSSGMARTIAYGWSLEEMKESSLWPLAHFIYPFLGLVYIQDRTFLLALIFIWETVEAISALTTNTYFGASDYIESIVDSWVSDPMQGFFGVCMASLLIITLHPPALVSNPKYFLARKSKRTFTDTITSVLKTFRHPERSKDTYKIFKSFFVCVAACFCSRLLWQLSELKSAVAFMGGMLGSILISAGLFLPYFDRNLWKKKCSFTMFHVSLFISVALITFPFVAKYLFFNNVGFWHNSILVCLVSISLLLSFLIILKIVRRLKLNPSEISEIEVK